MLSLWAIPSNNTLNEMLLKLYDKGDFMGHEETTQMENYDFSDDSPLYNFRKMITAAAAGIARRLQLNS
jgi:hypothetical protein